MLTYEVLVIVVAFVQPVVIGIVFFIGLNNYYSTSGFNFYYGGLRNKILTTKFYECSTYSRLNSVFVYNLNTISLLISFIIYDIDLLFFVSEVYFFNEYGLFEIFILASLISLFICGLFFESREFGFIWKV